MRPDHAGEVLREDVLMPLGLCADALAKALNGPVPRIHDVVRGRLGSRGGSVIDDRATVG